MNTYQGTLPATLQLPLDASNADAEHRASVIYMMEQLNTAQSAAAAPMVSYPLDQVRCTITAHNEAFIACAQSFQQRQ